MKSEGQRHVVVTGWWLHSSNLSSRERVKIVIGAFLQDVVKVGHEAVNGTYGLRDLHV